MSGGVSATTAVEVGVAVAVAGAAASAYGAMSAAHAQSQSDKFNAQVANNNAAIAQQNATFASQVGEQNAAADEQKNRAKVGGILANQAASGVDVNSDSAVDVRSSADELGDLDAMTIRSNAAKQAYGYQVDQTSNQNQSQLDTYAGNSATTAGDIGAAGSFLGSVGEASQNGGFGLSTADVMSQGSNSTNNIGS